MNARQGRLKALIHGDTWTDLQDLATASYNAILQQALSVEENHKAIELLHKARAAHDFSNLFLGMVVKTAEGDE